MGRAALQPGNDFDPDATRIMRPRPGGRAPAPPADPPSSDAPTALPEIPSPYPAGSLLAAAMPLLQLLGRLRTLAAETDPAALRDRTEAALRAFEARALADGVAPDHLRRAHYALCHSLDVAALNTPWGAASPWADRSMVATFHPAIGPDRFADALHQAETRPELGPILELMLACLSLGASDERSRRGAATALAAVAPAPPELSPNWQGIAAPYQPRAKPRLPVWVAAAAAVAVAAGVFVWLRAGVDARGDALFATMLATPPAQMPTITRDPAPPLPPPPPAIVPTLQDRIRARLAGASVTVAGSPAVPIIRLSDQALFATNGATLLPAAGAPIERLAAALRPEAGTLRILGYADDRPVRTVAFGSAFKLSAARAEAVRAALARALPGLAITAEGRGGADPIAPNGTESGREQNRRIDILFEGSPP